MVRYSLFSQKGPVNVHRDEINGFSIGPKIVYGGGEMWRRKGCPHCRDDLYIDEDVGRNYLKCLQCGYEKELAGKVLTRNNQAVNKRRVGVVPLI
jgi:hypothetical protein